MLMLYQLGRSHLALRLRKAFPPNTHDSVLREDDARAASLAKSIDEVLQICVLLDINLLADSQMVSKISIRIKLLWRIVCQGR